jgi:hypothetical protein
LQSSIERTCGCGGRHSTARLDSFTRRRRKTTYGRLAEFLSQAEGACPMIRRFVAHAAILTGSACLAACGSSGAQTATTSPRASTSSTQQTTSSAPVPSTTPASPTSTQTNYGSAQPAVNAYLKLQNLSDKAFTDPAHISSSTFDKYVIGSAKTTFDAALFNEKQANRYYRGTPAQQHVRVISTNLTAVPKSVVLYSCPTASPNDPFTEYDRKTGKPVPTGQSPKVAPPYGHTVKVAEFSGRWVVETFTVDATKTCRP